MTLSTEGRPDEKRGSLVINFDDNGLLSELFGEHDRHLARLEQELGVMATSRGNELVLTGTVHARERAEAVVKDLQSQVDAAILSNTMLTEEKEKHDSMLDELESKVIMLEERGKQANQALMTAHKALSAHREVVKDADTRIVSAIQSIQGGSKPKGQES